MKTIVILLLSPRVDVPRLVCLKLYSLFKKVSLAKVKSETGPL